VIPAAASWRTYALAAAFTLVAGVCALVTFGASYGGDQYLLVGTIGLAIGTLVALGGTWLRQPYWLVLGEGIIAYLLFGAAIVGSSNAVGHGVPGPSSLGVVARLAVEGWSGLLSTSPVVGNTQNLLVIPFLCGVACGVTTGLLALRAPRYPWATLPPLALMIVGILFGTDSDAARIVPGGLLAVVLISWVAHTQRVRRQSSDIGTGSRLNPLVGVALVVVCALVAVVAAPDVPLASSHVRYVLRDHIAPPFNLDQYQSPLSGFRKYVVPSQLRNQPVLTLSGVPDDTYVEFASMDAYDGVVYNVAQGSTASTASGNFATVGQPVSAEPCPQNDACHMAKISVHVLAYQGVWMPTAGYVRSVDFVGPGAGLLTNAFRYNVATNGAVTSVGLTRGDSYSIETDLPTEPAASTLNRAGLLQTAQPAPDSVPSVVRTYANKLTAGATTPYAKAQRLAQGLSTTGAYSDGYGNEAPSLPGHGASRIAQFLTLSQPVGDAEQYAVAMALMARSLGLPARVELGVDVKHGGDVTVLGKDVTAWVDIGFDGVGWVPFNPTPPTSAQLHVKNPPPNQSNTNQAQYQPPAQPLTNQSSELNNATGKGHTSPNAGSSVLSTVIAIGKILLLLLIIAAIVIGPALLILWMKARRRARRRNAPTPSAQIAGGWAEMLDRMSDAGTPVSGVLTRREQAVVLGGASPKMADVANAATFGSATPEASDVESFWVEIDRVVDERMAGLTRLQRLRVELNVRSLKPEASRLLAQTRSLVRQ
jgi:transglutaminase-like putative cysteine protease